MPRESTMPRPSGRCPHEEFALSYYRACPDDPAQVELCVSFDNKLHIVPVSQKKLIHDLKSMVDMLSDG